ncbi:THUMP domain protein [Thermoascus aurantiacus ATCC 26904]
MAEKGKRAIADSASHRSSKRRKGGEQWRKQQAAKSGRIMIESGDSGVFVTCDMGREGKCTAEALDLFSQSVEISHENTGKVEESEDDDDDIEAQIRKEVEGLKPKSEARPLFQAIRLDIPCLIFIRVDKSIDPVQLVHRLCAEAQANPEKKKSRWIKRMTPVTSIRKTLSVDLESFAKEILKPHFHAGGPPKKYAIRPTVRSNDQWKRDDIIKTIADVVGPGHSVDLKHYDLIILVDVVQNVIGMSVVGSDYDQLKRFNLAELYSPTPKPQGPKNDQN